MLAAPGTGSVTSKVQLCISILLLMKMQHQISEEGESNYKITSSKLHDQLKSRAAAEKLLQRN